MGSVGKCGVVTALILLNSPSSFFFFSENEEISVFFGKRKKAHPPRTIQSASSWMGDVIDPLVDVTKSTPSLSLCLPLTRKRVLREATLLPH